MTNELSGDVCPSCAARRDKAFEAWKAAAEPQQLVIILETLLRMKLRAAEDADGFMEDVMIIARVAFGAGGIAELVLIEENAEKQENADAQ